ncbi:MAG: hypothetical protein R3Y53_11540, partial [Bacillota bacterium]
MSGIDKNGKGEGMEKESKSMEVLREKLIKKSTEAEVVETEASTVEKGKKRVSKVEATTTQAEAEAVETEAPAVEKGKKRVSKAEVTTTVVEA